MIKSEMILHIKERFELWEEVYEMFNDAYGENMSIHPCINGWYIAFDGASTEDAYLTNKHPQSDESGQVITIKDFYK